MPDGSCMLFKLLHLLNALFSILVTFSESAICSRLLQFENAFGPIVVTLFGSETLFKLMQSSKKY